jgi:hypothetical protein
MSHAIPARVLDLEALAAEVADFLDEAPVAETMAAKLSRVLHGFLEGDVLPQAERAADLGLDPTPLLAVVSELLRLYADALRLPNPTGLWPSGSRTRPVCGRRAREYSPEQGEDAQLTGPHNRRPDRSRGRRHD